MKDIAKIFCMIPSLSAKILILELANKSCSMTLFFLSPFLLLNIKLPATEVTKIISGYGVGLLIGSFTIIYLKQYMHNKSILSFSFIVKTICSISLLQASGFISFFVIILTVGIANSFLNNSIIILFKNSLPFESNENLPMIGIFRTIKNIGLCIAGLLGSGISLINIKYIFIVEIIMFISCYILIKYIFYHQKPTPHKLNSDFIQNIKLIATQKDFLINMIIFFLAMSIWNLNISLLPIYLTEQCNIGYETIGLLFSFNSFIIILFEIVTLNAIKHTNLYLVSQIACILISFGFAILTVSNSMLIIIASYFIWSIGELLISPVTLHIAMSIVNQDEQQTLVATQQFVSTLSAIISPVIFGYFYYLSPELPWLICGIFVLLFPLLFFFLNSFRGSYANKNYN